MSTLQNYWQGLKPQEQKLLQLAGGVFAVFFIVMMVIRPLNNAVTSAKADYKNQQELLHYLEQSIVKLKAKGSAKVPGNNNVSSVVNRTRGRYQIEISRMQPNSDGLRVTIDNVEFNKLLSWLEELVYKQGVHVKNIELAQGDQPGFVRVSRIELE